MMASRTGGGAKEHAHPGSLLLAIHDFVARSTDELSLAKGDRIELVERDDDFGDGWFLGKHMHTGKTGLFPEVYTTPAPKGTLNNPPNIRRRSDDPQKSSQDGSVTALPAMAGALAATASSTTAQRPASASSSQPSTSPMALRTSAPLTSPIVKPSIATVDSPVMNETLSVIDEHMNDMNAPRSPFPNGSSNTLTSSLASTPQQLARYSYIAGHETDEEESHVHTEEEVLAWSPDQVAEYLEDNGVEHAHCEVFQEQEISGEVLLAMEQSSIFLKEFDLGPVGRRLRTWHKIRQLQDEVRTSSPAKVPRSNSEYSNVGDESTSDATRNRASTMGSILPRALDPRQSISQPQRSTTLQSLSSSAAPFDQTHASAMSPLQSMTSMTRSDTASRPSAQIIREMQHSRRHSSMDSTKSASLRQGHRKQPSLDQRWQLGQLQTNGSPASHGHTLSADTGAQRQSAFMTTSPDDIDRGYFSSNEADSRPSRRSVLTKRNSAAAASPAHSRQSSSATQRNRQSVRGQISSPIGPVSPVMGAYGNDSGIFGPLNSVGDRYGSMRSVTAPTAQVKPSVTAQKDLSPVVTKLDYNNGSNEGSMAQAMRKDSTQKSSSPISKMSFFTSKPKITGLRTISDAITRSEKSSASPTKEGAPFSSRTGSTTPSTETQSFEMQKSEGQSHHSNGSATNLPLPPARQQQRRMRPKTKKSTSAYTRGLEQKSPAEQIAVCDYSGWMRKKSGSLMTTWKPRLFVLRGRRLSYYYSDSDTEEKGLIDISFHRVLPAHNETLTGLHATVTGATNATSSPRESSTPTSAQRDLVNNPPPPEDDSVFIFKLVPPKSGLSKGVNFTRPTVHYFAVNSRQEGRLWMAALMKATIDYDEHGKVTTTYNQKTISLAKARARRERPPALREDPPEDVPEDEMIAELDGSPDTNKTGLGIGGLGEQEDAGAGASRDAKDASLYTTGTTAVAESDEKLVEKEGEGIAS